jgi:multiple sugar transport system substrate-binding protein
MARPALHSRSWLCLGGWVIALAAVLAAGGCLRRVPAVGTYPQTGLPNGESLHPTEITFAYWALAPREVETVHQMVRDFEGRKPGVRVRLVEVSDKYYEKLTTMFAAGTAPDAFVINYGRLGDFARRGLLADLKPLSAATHSLGDAQFVTAAYQCFESVGRTVGRPGLFALPRDWGPTNLLVYNKDTFDAAGLAYPSPGMTWQQFAEACRRLTSKQPGAGVQRYGAAVCLYPYAFAGWVFQNGGEFLSPDGNHSRLADASVTDTVDYLKGLVTEGTVAPVSVEKDRSLEQFRQGKAAMAFVTPYSLGELRRQEGLRWGVAPPLVGMRQATGCIPTGVAISARSSHQEAAGEFVAYWATVGAENVCKAGFCVPAWRSALDSPALDEGFGAETAAVLRSATAYARPYPVSPRVPYESMLADLKRALEDVFATDKSPTQAFHDAQARIDAAAQSAR